ncbi:MAG: SAM-dependent chlorinase/fluorinase [Chloroflexi bacterium]|nr:SAM-dependent chlorinase/fluorinase [Chloroflexota bacterium]
MQPITLTTDFGLRDAYVAAVKGVILGINPKATVVDISHFIEPQNIRQAAFVLGTVYCYFPRDTIHMVIVDPEVGSRRRAIILKTQEALFVAPDNGVLSYVLHHASPGGMSSEAALTVLPPGVMAVEITNPKFWHHPVSTTFHGRDIFAPVTAHLSLGVPLQEFGEPTMSLQVFPPPRPRLGPGGELVGQVLHVDIFGNVITSIRQQDLRPGRFHLQIAGRRIESLAATYANAEIDQLHAVVGSSGYVEVAVRNGSAAALLGVKIGDEVEINNR